MSKTSIDYSFPLKWMKYSLWLSLVLTLVKVVAWQLTHSSAILSDAVESVVNIIAGSFGLYSIWLSSKPSDAEHPYGHGKIEFISSAIEGLMVFIAGMTIIWQGVIHLINPQKIENLGLGIVFILISTVCHFVVGTFLINKGKSYHSPTLEANGRHLRSDGISSIALIVGLVLILISGKIWIDNAVAILFGLYILYEGFGILRKSMSGIMDETDNEIIQSMVDVLQTNRRPSWIDIHNFRVIKYGSVLHVDCHMTLPWYFNNAACHDQIEKVDDVVNSQLERKVELFIHVDPCIPLSCKVCSVQNCKERQFPQREIIIWNLDRMVANTKHN
jgi:cation diffusion facilitator family transporter